jgi:PIN domain nuclease of toxin-antitoxin system
MKLLLDTHMLLWAAAGTLPEKAPTMVVDKSNTLYFSAAKHIGNQHQTRAGQKRFCCKP